jgi:hypothetical protein
LLVQQQEAIWEETHLEQALIPEVKEEKHTAVREVLLDQALPAVMAQPVVEVTLVTSGVRVTAAVVVVAQQVETDRMAPHIQPEEEQVQEVMDIQEPVVVEDMELTERVAEAVVEPAEPTLQGTADRLQMPVVVVEEAQLIPPIRA